MTQSYVVRVPADLYGLRQKTGLSEVTVHTALLKYRRLVPAALRYAVFALKPGGTLTVIDDGADDPVSPPFQVNFGLMKQWAFRLLDRDCRLVEMDPAPGRLTFARTGEITSAEWAAGVVFSGSDQEAPALHACLDGLLNQPELAGRPGAVVVCGPAAGRTHIDAYPTVRYLDFETPPGPRFLIGIKKNLLAAHLDAAKIAIMHCRIVLQPGCLAAVPAEFDIGTPNVMAATADGGLEPYISLCFADLGELGRAPTARAVTTRNVPPERYLEIHERGAPYADGGVFFASRAVYQDCALDEDIAWGEAEDVEWCARAANLGYLVDLFPASIAVSQTNKIPARPGVLTVLPAVATAWAAQMKFELQKLRHIALGLAGKR